MGPASLYDGEIGVNLPPINYCRTMEIFSHGLLYHVPSLQRFKSKTDKTPGKRGAPIGHKGATKVLGEPDEIIHVSEEKCPKCSHILGSPIRKYGSSNDIL